MNKITALKEQAIMTREVRNEFKEIQHLFHNFKASDKSIGQKVLRLYVFFDKIVFNKRLSSDGSLLIKITNGLNYKVGMAGLSTHCKGRKTITMSRRYAINFNRICSIILHEMCHLAQWCINHDRSNGVEAHNELWHYWAEKCNRCFPKFKVEAFHDWKPIWLRNAIWFYLSTTIIWFYVYTYLSFNLF